MADPTDPSEKIDNDPVLSDIYEYLIKQAITSQLDKYFVTSGDDSVYVITGNNPFTDKEENFLDIRAKGKGLLLAVTGDYLPGNPHFKRVKVPTTEKFRYETLITSKEDVDAELIKWVKSSYDSFLVPDTRTVEEKKQRWEKVNKNCLAEGFRGGLHGPEYGFEAIKLATEVFGKDSIELADSNKNIAVAFLYQGYPDSAMKYSNYAYPVATKLLDQHPETADEILHQHAVILHANKDFKQAETLYKKVLALREKSKTIDEDTLAQSLGDLARLYSDTGRDDEAEKTNIRARNILQKYMDERKDKQGNEYFSALYNHTAICSNIGIYQRLSKQFDEASKTYISVVNALQEFVKLGGQPPDSLLKNIHANIQTLQEEHPAARSQLKATVSKLEKIIPPDNRTDYQQALDYLLKK
jgi:hypothetical protein